MIRQQAGDESYQLSDIQWVLTVPAIWTPRAKQFMREGAYTLLPFVIPLITRPWCGSSRTGRVIYLKQTWRKTTWIALEAIANVIRLRHNDKVILSVVEPLIPRTKKSSLCIWQAGIGSRDNPEQLLIALEPEAAAVFLHREETGRIYFR